MKTFFAALCSFGLLLSTSLFTNAQSFSTGTTVINLGIGTNATSYWTNMSEGTYRNSPVFAGSFECAATKLGPGTLGLGLGVAYQSAMDSFNYQGQNNSFVSQTNRWHTLVVGARGTYHPDFCNGKNYDVYAVLQISYVHYGYTFSTTDPQLSGYNVTSNLNSGIRPYILIGGRYYFGNTFGLFAEVGYDIAHLKGGICLRFNGNGK